jgi:hypothetical protein
MVVSEVDLFEVLSQQLGAEKAKTVVHYVEAKVDKRLEEKTNVFATKGDIFAIKEDIAKLETKIAESKADLIKWMFIFWIGSVGVISGIMVAVLNAYLRR